ncbi:MAG: metallophosphoesterase family protein [Bacilli bacterium]|nr:metallophosphoesterase family protein [Bacilli bacterium]
MKRLIKVFSVMIISLSLLLILGGIKVKAAYDMPIFHLITTNPGEDASTTIGINYHTPKAGSHIEYTLVTDKDFSKAISLTPEEKTWSIKGQTNADEKDTFYTVERYVCSATLTNLTPCTKYKYRLVNGSDISNTYFFTTAGLTNDWSFVALADCQYGKNKVSHNMIRTMQEIANNPALVVCSGDMTDYGGREEEVTWFLDNPVMQDFIFASAPGDHEYWARDISGSKLFTTPYVYNNTFNFPKNGANLALNSNYYFYYNNVLFVMIDTDDSDTVSSSKMSQEVNWFKTTIKALEGTYQYLVVLGHKSIYSAYSNDSRVFTTIRPQWYPVFDECGVDLVISGHDHMYSRTYKLYDGKVIDNAGDNRYKGTYYLDLGSSGDKTRELEQAILEDGLHVDGPDIKKLGWVLASHIEVSDKIMKVTVYNQYKNVVDTFTVLPKRSALAVDVSGLDQEALLDDAKMTIDSFTAQTGKLTFTDGEMLKYVKRIQVVSGDTVCLDTKVNYNANEFSYDVSNMSKVNYEIIFTLNDNTEIKKDFSCDYWGSSGLKIKDAEKLILTWSTTISNLSEYTWKVYVDGELYKSLKNNDLMMASLTLPNKYLVGDHEIKIELMLGDKVEDTYTVNHVGAAGVELSKEEVNIKVGETINLDYVFEYEDLLKIKVEDPTVASYENGIVKGLKQGTTEITFTVKDTDLVYKCKVNVTGGSGCNGKAASDLIALFSMLSIAFFIRRKH